MCLAIMANLFKRSHLKVYMLILFLLFLLPHDARSQQQILFVKVSADRPCPNNRKIVECQTLDWYANRSNCSFMSNKQMLFEDGVHLLQKFITVSGCVNFTMTGNGTAVPSSNGYSHPTSIINCSRESQTNSGLFFSYGSNIHIRNLELISCSGQYTLKSNFNFAGSLAFNVVQNITLDQILVYNAMGYGLHTNDVSGTLHVLDSAFLYARKHKNISDSANAKFFFGDLMTNISIDTTLVIKSSWFMYGETTGLYNAAGGLNVFIHRPRVHVRMTNITAQGNIGENGGNVALFLVVFTLNVNSGDIVLSHSRVIDGRATKGGGLRFWSKQNQTSGDHCVEESIDHQLLVINNTLFHNNTATITGGAMYVAYYNINNSVHSGIEGQITISHCKFTHNIANGAAMEIIQHSSSYHHMTHWFQTSLEMCSFECNFMPLNNDGPVLDFISVDVTMTNCRIIGSNTTAIALRNTYLNLLGDIHFENNSARVGGALKVCEASLIFVHSGTHVRFLNNTAQKGGAVYVQQSCTDTWPLCFIQVAVPKDIPVVEFVKWMHVEFINNSATIAGDTLYGGDLDTCSTIEPYYMNNTQQRSSYWYSKTIFLNGIFKHYQQNGPSWISSNPRGVCFCNESHTYDLTSSTCSSTKYIKSYPGKTFTISVIPVGQMNGTTIGTIDTSLDEEGESHYLNVSRLNSQQHSHATCIQLSITLNSNRNSALIDFKPVTAEIATKFETETVNLTVQLLRCPLGFQLSTVSPYNCVCNPLLLKPSIYDPQITCDITSQTISFQQKELWFGCLDDDKQQFHNASSTCTNTVFASCNLYCRNAENTSNTTVTISVVDIDSQCLPGHTGIMCGACKPEYSRMLGGTIECQKNCTNKKFTLMLITFIASGFVIIIVIIALNLTITEGTLNGLLVYTNVIQTYFVEPHFSGFGKICWIFISWINLSLGIKTCFYRGMDAYQQIWILFAQVFYYLAIFILIIFLSRKFMLITRLFGRNIIKVLATLVFLLYSNLQFVTLNTFRYAILLIDTSNGTNYTKLAWYFDGNVPYFGFKHAMLFIVAVICTIAMLIFVFSLLLIQCLQKQSHLWFFRWVDRWRPFYEACNGPCHDNYRFWPGFLLFMRSGLYIVNSLIPSYIDAMLQIKMLITTAVFIIIMSLSCIFPKGVYKRWPLNILEFSFYLNLCITSAILSLSYDRNLRVSAVYTSVSISALTFFGILVYHFHSQMKGTTIYKKIAAGLRYRYSQFYCRTTTRRFSSENFDDDERDPLLPQQPMPSFVKFNHSCEPLVDE